MVKCLERLEKRKACSPSLIWLTQMPDPETAWDKCPNGAWMCWLLDQLNIPHAFKEKLPEDMALEAYHSAVTRHHTDEGIPALEEKLEKASTKEKVMLRVRIMRIMEEADQLGKKASRRVYLEEAQNLADAIRAQFPKVPPLDTL